MSARISLAGAQKILDSMAKTPDDALSAEDKTVRLLATTVVHLYGVERARTEQLMHAAEMAVPWKHVAFLAVEAINAIGKPEEQKHLAAFQMAIKLLLLEEPSAEDLQEALQVLGRHNLAVLGFSASQNANEQIG